MAEVRIATFNLENFDETAPDEWPSLAERIELMRPQIVRLRASIACFQEVNGQERPNQPRSLLALAELLAGTNLAGAELASTRTADDEVYDERNLVVASTFPVRSVQQLRNDLVEPLLYRRLTAKPPDAAAVAIDIERPIVHVQLDLTNGTRLHVINVHLKSKIPTNIPGQKIDVYTWRSADAWAEGSFISSMKRMSQAVEARRLVDQIFDADPNAQIVVAGDFNAAPDEVPVMAIRGDPENTGNPDLVARVLVPIEQTIPAPRPIHAVPPGPRRDARPHAYQQESARSLPRFRNPQRDPARRVRRLRHRSKISRVRSRPRRSHLRFLTRRRYAAASRYVAQVAFGS